MQYHKARFQGDGNFNRQKIQHLLGQLDVIIGTKELADLKPHKDAMLRLSRPKSFNIYEDGNEELAMTNGFYRFVFMIEEHTTRDIRKMPTTEVYSLIDLIEEKNKPKDK